MSMSMSMIEGMTMSDATASTREWRLYALAVVAGVYVLAWSRIVPQHRTTSAPPDAVWLDELPRDRRPSIAPPAGWRVATRNAAAPVLRRVPAAQPPRLRTRSS